MTCGVGIIIFGISLIFHTQDTMTYAFVGSAVILGVIIALGGWAIARGEKIKDIIEIIIVSIR